MSDADLIRSTVQIRDVLEALELPPPDRAGKIPSWLRDETVPSVQIYEQDGRDNWFDYGAGQGGDVIALVQSYFGCSFGKAVRYLSGLADEGMVVRRHVRIEKPVIDLTGRLYNESRPLGNEAIDFILRTWGYDAFMGASRGFEVRQANGALWIPHWAKAPASPVELSVVGIKVRAYNGQRFSVDGSNFRQRLYTAQLRKYNDVAVLTEGEPDTWTLYYKLLDRADVYGLPSGAGTWNDAWLGQLEGYKSVIVCLDNDDAGQKATHTIVARLITAKTGLVIPVTNDLPEKDISDAVRLHNYDPVKEWGL